MKLSVVNTDGSLTDAYESPDTPQSKARELTAALQIPATVLNEANVASADALHELQMYKLQVRAKEVPHDPQLDRLIAYAESIAFEEWITSSGASPTEVAMLERKNRMDRKNSTK